MSSAFTIARRREDVSHKRAGDADTGDADTADSADVADTSAVRRSKRLKGFPTEDGVNVFVGEADMPAAPAADSQKAARDRAASNGAKVHVSEVDGGDTASAAAPALAPPAKVVSVPKLAPINVHVGGSTSAGAAVASVGAPSVHVNVVPPVLPSRAVAGGVSGPVSAAPGPSTRSPWDASSSGAPASTSTVLAAGLAAGMTGTDRLHPASRRAKSDVYEKQEKIGEVRDRHSSLFPSPAHTAAMRGCLAAVCTLSNDSSYALTQRSCIMFAHPRPLIACAACEVLTCVRSFFWGCLFGGNVRPPGHVRRGVQSPGLQAWR
jgi:hypothetical protein